MDEKGFMIGALNIIIKLEIREKALCTSKDPAIDSSQPAQSFDRNTEAHSPPGRGPYPTKVHLEAKKFFFRSGGQCTAAQATC